jgi:hypothetical protein
VLVNPANPATAETTARDVQAAARGIGSQVEGLDASTSREIHGAFATVFFANRPTHSSWAAIRFSDAGNNGTLRTSRMAAEVGQEVQ